MILYIRKFFTKIKSFEIADMHDINLVLTLILIAHSFNFIMDRHTEKYTSNWHLKLIIHSNVNKVHGLDSLK